MVSYLYGKRNSQESTVTANAYCAKDGTLHSTQYGAVYTMLINILNV